MRPEIILSRLYEMISEDKQEKFERIALSRTNYLSVILENFQKSHNTSAVLRTCECLGIQNISMIGESLQSAPQVKISKGSENWLTVHSFNQPNPIENCVFNLREKGYKIVATSPNAKQKIDDISLDKPIALFFGTEREGISNYISEESDELVSLPMFGFTESYNVSVSAAIILSKLRDRLEASAINWKLNKEEQTALKLEWCKRLINNGHNVAVEIERRLSDLIEKE